ncbi:MAG: DUF167 domain-containing protein [archaeon]
MIDPSNHIRGGALRILVKPGKRDNRIVSYDAGKDALVIEIKAQAQKNKANIEVVKFFSKLLKKDVKIKTGLTSKEKLLSIR